MYYFWGFSHLLALGAFPCIKAKPFRACQRVAVSLSLQKDKKKPKKHFHSLRTVRVRIVGALLLHQGDKGHKARSDIPAHALYLALILPVPANSEQSVGSPWNKRLGVTSGGQGGVQEGLAAATSDGACLGSVPRK